MVVPSPALVFLFSILPTFANPAARSPLVLHEQRDSIPQGFVLDGPAPPSTLLTLRVALTSNNLPGLESVLYDVSTPGKLYGQYLTKEEVEAFVAPSAETNVLVEEWLSTNGIQATSISPAGDWLSFTLPVSKANQLLDANFSVFKEKATGDQAIRTLAYSIPANLVDHVNLIHPTIAFPVKSTIRPVVFTPGTTSVPSSNSTPCADHVDPTCVRTLYGLPLTVGPQTASQIGVAGFIDQFAQKADLSAFLHEFRPDLTPQPTFALQTLDGGKNPQSPDKAGTEANLDIEYTVGIAGGVPVTFISVGMENTDNLNGFIDIIDFLVNQTNPPQVLSTSYGFDEPDLPHALAKQLCNAHMQLGARGVSVLFSSGDGGVSGSQSQPCGSDSVFIPTFPSGCPYVTSIGGTGGFRPEIGANFSSGGFSNIFHIPSFQKAAVDGYLEQLGDKNSGLYNKTGRAYPDMSAQGVDVLIISGGQKLSVGGTSCSCPIVASLIAQINARRLQQGKCVLGYLNPLIYSTPYLFTDITTGYNPGCNTDGFPAAPGWDPVTGLGTPIFSAFDALPY